MVQAIVMSNNGTFEIEKVQNPSLSSYLILILRLHRHIAKIYPELWWLRNCKILQPKFLLEFQATFFLPWYRESIDMSFIQFFLKLLNFTTPLLFIRILGQYFFALVRGCNCNAVLCDFRNYNILQPQFVFLSQLSFRLHRQMAIIYLEVWA